MKKTSEPRQSYRPKVEGLENRQLLDATSVAQSIFTALMSRPPDAQSLTALAGQLGAGLSPSALASSLVNSTEFRSGIVENFYTNFLNRPGDAAGLNAWANLLGSGVNEIDIANFFVASPEYTLAQPTTPSFLTALYGDALNRAPDAGGMAAWSALLDSGLATRAQVGAAFVNSPEFIGNEVANAFTTVLGRQPNAAELNASVAGIQTRALSLMGLFNNLVNTAEFTNAFAGQLPGAVATPGTPVTPLTPGVGTGTGIGG